MTSNLNYEDLDLVGEILIDGANSVEEVIIVLDRVTNITKENTPNDFDRESFIFAIELYGIPTASLRKNPVFLVSHKKVEINYSTKEVFSI